MSFAWAYAERTRSSGPRTFVVQGISHVQTVRRFLLTAKDFQTPLGSVPADREFLRRPREGSVISRHDVRRRRKACRWYCALR